MNTQTWKGLLPSEPWWVGVRQAAVRVVDVVARLRQAAFERRQLLALSDRDLQDIGISRIDALQEAEKPLWRDAFAAARPWKGPIP